MSLDVYLSSPPTDKCPHCGRGGEVEKTGDIYDANITHNLGTMAAEAGIYTHLWRPEEIGITTAAELIEPLTKGLELMQADPDRFKKHNAPNGWGLYEHFVPWIQRYLDACIVNPTALVSVCR